MTRLLFILAFLAVQLLSASPILAGDGAGPRITFDVKEAPLRDVVDLVRNAAGANIVFGRDHNIRPLREKRDLTVTLNLEDVPWEEALERACALARVRVDRTDESVLLLSRIQPIQMKLDDADASLVLHVIGRFNNVNVVVQPGAVMGKKLSVDFKNRDWIEVLPKTIAKAGLTLLSDRDEEVFLVAEPDFAEAAKSQWRAWPVPAGKGPKPPEPKLDIDVEGKPLFEVVEWIREVSARKIFLGKSWNGTPLEEDPRTRTTLKLKDLSWLSILRYAAQNANTRLITLGEEAWLVEEPYGMTMLFHRAEFRPAMNCLSAVSGIEVNFGDGVGEGRLVNAGMLFTTWHKMFEGLAAAGGYVVEWMGKGRKCRIVDPRGASRNPKSQMPNPKSQQSAEQEGEKDPVVEEFRKLGAKVTGIVGHAGEEGAALVNGMLVAVGGELPIKGEKGEEVLLKLDAVIPEFGVWFVYKGKRIRWGVGD